MQKFIFYLSLMTCTFSCLACFYGFFFYQHTPQLLSFIRNLPYASSFVNQTLFYVFLIGEVCCSVVFVLSLIELSISYVFVNSLEFIRKAFYFACVLIGISLGLLLFVAVQMNRSKSDSSSVAMNLENHSSFY